MTSRYSNYYILRRKPRKSVYSRSSTVRHLLRWVRPRVVDADCCSVPLRVDTVSCELVFSRLRHHTVTASTDNWSRRPQAATTPWPAGRHFASHHSFYLFTIYYSNLYSPIHW